MSIEKSIARKARRAAPAFDPNKLPFATTMVRQVTRQHLRHINNVFWLHERAHDYIRNGYQSIPQPPPQIPPRGVFRDEGSWRDSADNFRTWVRQNTVISAASILEVYIVSACTATFEACPELVSRAFVGIDSVKYLKFPHLRPPTLKDRIKDKSESMTTGKWARRFRGLENEIGRVPQAAMSLTAKLQDLQDLRNRIAHSYGSDGELRRTPWEPVRAIQIEDTELFGALRVVDQVTKILDQGLFGPPIGGFEMMNEYANWTRVHPNFNHVQVKGNHVREFKNYIGEAFGAPPSEQYLRAMIDYYDKIQPSQ